MHSVVEINHLDDAPYKALKLGVAQTPVGPAALVWDDHGLRALSLNCNGLAAMAAIKKMGVSCDHDDLGAASMLADVFEGRDIVPPLILCGTSFQRQVWRTLMSLELGQTVSYGELAQRVGKPLAARAVGSAVGANTLGFLVPCHRVIRQDGVIGQFRWGTEVKRRLLAWEAEIAQ